MLGEGKKADIAVARKMKFQPGTMLVLRRIEVWLEEKQETIVFIEQPEAGGLDGGCDPS